MSILVFIIWYDIQFVELSDPKLVRKFCNTDIVRISHFTKEKVSIIIILN